MHKNRTSLMRIYAKYVSLNVIGMIGLSCYILADTYFIAQAIGANGLTALNLALPIYFVIHGIGLMIGMGGATRYALNGSKKVFTNSIYYASFVAFIFFIIALFYSDALATLLGADAYVFENTKLYLRTILYFSPLFMLNNIIICFVRNDGNPNLSMLAMFIGSLSNILLDYILMYPLDMGMLGAALATGISPIISLSILSLHFISHKNTFSFIKTKPSYHYIKDISFLGSSALINELSSGVVIVVYNFLILGLQGNIGVAAYGIIANISLVILSVFTGIAQGIQPIISQSYRTGNFSNMVTIRKYAFFTSALFSVMAYLFSILNAEQLITFFNKNDDLQLAQIAINGMSIYFSSFIFAGINIISAAYFSATDTAKNAFLVSMLRGIVLIIPFAFLFSWIFKLNGVWLSVVINEFAVTIVCLYLLYKQKAKY